MFFSNWMEIWFVCCLERHFQARWQNAGLMQAEGREWGAAAYLAGGL
jgi:hypothetical protein